MNAHDVSDVHVGTSGRTASSRATTWTVTLTRLLTPLGRVRYPRLGRGSAATELAMRSPVNAAATCRPWGCWW